MRYYGSTRQDLQRGHVSVPQRLVDLCVWGLSSFVRLLTSDGLPEDQSASVTEITGMLFALGDQRIKRAPYAIVDRVDLRDAPAGLDTGLKDDGTDHVCGRTCPVAN